MEAYEVRALLWKQKVVLIDEVRPTASTAFDDTELAKWMCHAYDAKYAVFITTNVNPLADVLGPPAASRFTQIVIDGPDRRQA
jgi:chloramphenicol O-acetyltransferase